MIAELKQEVHKGNITEVKAIAENVEENEQKISYHGKRADAIVKSMMQHPRSAAGEKQLVDINVLTDEYLRVSYHGFRAKDKDFHVKIEMNFEQSIGKVNIVPQGMGRVLLNLFNNAFYAAHERLKKAGEGYEPIVSVSTRKL